MAIVSTRNRVSLRVNLIYAQLVLPVFTFIAIFLGQNGVFVFLLFLLPPTALWLTRFLAVSKGKCTTKIFINFDIRLPECRGCKTRILCAQYRGASVSTVVITNGNGDILAEIKGEGTNPWVSIYTTCRYQLLKIQTWCCFFSKNNNV